MPEWTKIRLKYLEVYSDSRAVLESTSEILGRSSTAECKSFWPSG